MIIVGRNNPHAYYDSAHIAVPYGNGYKYFVKPPQVYVGDSLVYPEPYRYTLIYRCRADICVMANAYVGDTYKQGYIEQSVEGYVEDTVRLDTVYPVYLLMRTCPMPQGYVISAPNAPSSLSFSGWDVTELLVTPSIALHGSTGNREVLHPNYAEPVNCYDGIYQRFTSTQWNDLWRPTGHDGYKITVQRNVMTITDHPVDTVTYRKEGDIDKEYDDYTRSRHVTEYTLESMYSIPKISGGYDYSNDQKIYKRTMVFGRYMSGSAVGPEEAYMRTGNYDLGFVRRYEQGGFALYLGMDLRNHRGSTRGLIPYGEAEAPVGSIEFSGGPRMLPRMLEYTLLAPPFTGRKQFRHESKTYTSNYYGLGAIPHMPWTDYSIDASVTIIYNNNPTFATIQDYVQAYFGQ